MNCFSNSLSEEVTNEEKKQEVFFWEKWTQFLNDALEKKKIDARINHDKIQKRNSRVRCRSIKMS